ncbi:Junctophilin-1, partial [Cichlidogyrus casuarinus]
MFGGPISEEDLEDPTLFGEFAGSNSPSMNRQAQEAKGDYLNAKSLQVSGSRRGSFRSSFRRNHAYKHSMEGSEGQSESAQHGNTLVPPAQLSPKMNLKADTNLQDVQVSVPPIKSPKQLDPAGGPDNLPQVVNTLPNLTIEVPPLVATSDQQQINEICPLDPVKQEQMRKLLERGVRDVTDRQRRNQQPKENFLPPKRDFDQMSLDQARMQSLANDTRFDQTKAGISASRHTLNLGAELAGTESRYEQLQLLNKKLGEVIGKFTQFAFQHPHSQYLMLDEIDEPVPDQKMAQCKRGTEETANERRRTLPNIMTEPPIKVFNPGLLIHHEMDAEEVAKVNSFTPDDTYIIEDGLRKRLHIDKPRSIHQDSDSPTPRIASSKYPNAIPGVPPPSYQAHETAKRITLGHEEKMLPGVHIEEFNRGLMRESSMPDIAGTLDTAANRNMSVKLVGISREEVSKMSQARRQELLEESKWRSRNEIVIRLADIK